MRNGSVGISGTSYLPPIPNYDNAERELNEILSKNTTATEKALDVFAWGARSQLFWDGNKRTSMTAANKIKKNSFAAVLICFTQFLILFILFKFGLGPLWARYIGILSCIIFSFLVKPYILYKDINYSLKELYFCIFHCLKVAIIVFFLSYLVYILIPQNNVWDSIASAILSVVIVFCVVCFCIDKNIKLVVFYKIKELFNIK